MAIASDAQVFTLNRFGQRSVGLESDDQQA